MFDFGEIRRLVELVDRSDIGELEVSRLWGRVKIRKRSADAPAEVMMPRASAHSRAEEPPAPTRSSDADAAAAPDSPPPISTLIEIRSPMVGTFYRAPAPDAEIFTEVGKAVKKGDVVCIVEAMKLMNEIESEVEGVITKILVENAQPVQYDQPLFLVEPA
jgi:acetyl-CoA carboxylase biotin carboxyl carrier protein